MCLGALVSTPLMNTSWCYLTLGWLNQYYPSFFIEHRTFMEEQMVLYGREESVRLERIRLCTSCNAHAHTHTRTHAHTHTHTHTHNPCSIEPVRLILSVKRLGLERLPRLWWWMCAWLQNEPTDFMNALMLLSMLQICIFQSVFGCFNLTSKYQYIWKKFLLFKNKHQII